MLEHRMDPHAVDHACASHATYDWSADWPTLVEDTGRVGLVGGPRYGVEIAKEAIEIVRLAQDTTRGTDDVDLPTIVTLKNNDPVASLPCLLEGAECQIGLSPGFGYQAADSPLLILDGGRSKLSPSELHLI
jgi:hypothetical protein